MEVPPVVDGQRSSRGSSLKFRVVFGVHTGHYSVSELADATTSVATKCAVANPGDR
jgi:hypothetical protein